MTVLDSEKLINLIWKNCFSINSHFMNNPIMAQIINTAIASSAEDLLGPNKIGKFSLDEMTGGGEVRIPFTSFGNTSSYQLINFHELSLFRIYHLISSNYSLALDLGANIGLHSVIMAKAGFKKIVAVEPDTNHLEVLKSILEINQIKNVELKNFAISDMSGNVKFTRVMGNLTGSHISGSKENLYGELSEIDVVSETIMRFLEPGIKTFIKMDIESHEAAAISMIPKEYWFNIDMCLEIGNFTNAKAIFEYCNKNSIYLFSQMRDWRIISELSDVPKRWQDGSALISSNPNFFENIVSK